MSTNKIKLKDNNMKELLTKSTNSVALNVAQKIAFGFIMNGEAKKTTLPTKLIERAFKTLAIEVFEYQLKMFKKHLYNNVSWEITDEVTKYPSEPDDIIDVMDQFHSFYEEYLRA